VFQNRVLRRTLEPIREQATKGQRNFMSSFIICTTHPISLGLLNSGMARACSMHNRNKTCAETSGNFKQQDHLEKLTANGRIITKWSVEEQGVKVGERMN
jgi:hypothetical protein